MSTGRTLFKLGYEVSPIIFTNGIASAIPGNMLPIISITEAANFTLGLLNGAEQSLDNFFAHFRPLPGATLQNNQVGKYPFASQETAANAVITQPLSVSLVMTCPVRSAGGYTSKSVTLTALKKAIDIHVASGGTFIVATPSYIYQNCILTNLRDISSGESKQAQTDWQWDFEQPLLSLQDAQKSQSALMQKISSGAAIDGTPGWSGLATSVGSQVSGLASSVVQNAQNLVGSAITSAVSLPSVTVNQIP
ncbi:hypothetical protein [Herbaspirillum huttiense]|uniref:hypothetical protein n=1 Tax=Herbaspirillum huttiense TaxID=863372 RepID=UPI0031DA3358